MEPVAAIVPTHHADAADGPARSILMVEGHVTSPLLESVLIRTAAGAQPAKVEARLASLSARYPGLTVGDRHDLALRVDASRESNEWLFRILAGIVFAFTAIAVVNTLVMIGLHRTRELALLRLIGTQIATRLALRARPVDAIGIRE